MLYVKTWGILVMFMAALITLSVCAAEELADDLVDLLLA